MGLLEKAAAVRSEPSTGGTDQRRGLLSRASFFRNLSEEKPGPRGLLARASLFRETGQAAEQKITAPKGLLARAIEMRNTAASAEPAPLPVKGLLKRAEELLRSSEKKGLLARASLFRNHQDESKKLMPQARGLLARAAAFRADQKSETVNEEVMAAPEPLSDYKPAEEENVPETEWHEDIEPIGFHPDAELIEDPFPELKDVQEKTEPETAEEFSLPEYQASEKWEDPALDPHLHRESAVEMTEETETDPFEEWEREAESLAENQIKEILPEEDKETDKQFLFREDEDSFITRSEVKENINNKKLENYQALFDITSELSSIDDFSEFWETVQYSLIGQLGAAKVCVFSSQDALEDNVFLYLSASGGFDPPENWSIKKTDELYDYALSKGTIFYTSALSSGALSDTEKEILEVTEARLAVPVTASGKLIALILVSGSVQGQREYSPEDTEYAGLTGKLAASGALRILSRLKTEKEVAEIRKRNAIHKVLFSAAASMQNAPKTDELYDIMLSVLKDSFGAQSVIFYLYSSVEARYRIFSGTHISPATAEKFSLSADSDFVSGISQITRVYDIRGFRNNPDIVNLYPNDVLAVMRNFFILPLIHQGWLAGFITIHQTERPLTDMDREMLVNFAAIAAPFTANAVMRSEREGVFRDPFSPVEARLRADLKKALEYQASLSFAEFRVKNIKRIFALNPADQVISFLQEVGNLISSRLYNTDYYTRIGQGRFAVILPGRSRSEAAAFLNGLKAEIKKRKLLPGSPVEIQFAESVITAPEDTDDPERILSLID